MSTTTVEIALGLQAEFLKVPLTSAQTAALAEFKAAGNDLGALATKAGTSIAFLQITGARIVTHAAGPVLVLSIAVDSGNPNAVVGALANIAVTGLATKGIILGGEFLASLSPVGRVVGPVAVPVVGVGLGALLGKAAGDAVERNLNEGPAGDWVNAHIGPLLFGTRATPGLPPLSGTPTFLPPANQAPFTQLVVNPSTGIPMLVFNSNPNLTYGANVAPGPTNYVVQPNDTSFTIAAKNGWSESGLIAANPQLGPNFTVRPGQIINGLPPVSVNNSSLTVSTNTNPTAVQRTGPADLIGTANNINQGILISGGAKFVSMKPSDVGPSSTGVFAATFSSSIVTDGFRPGNFNISAGGFQGLRAFPITNAYQNFFSGAGQLQAATFTNLGSLFSSNIRFTDPLVLDLNGDGVKLTNFTGTPVLFDIDHDGGSLEVTGWVSSQDGIVVHDLNGNGVIDNISETLSEYYNGTAGTGGNAGTKPFADGFAALKSLDSNLDNVFNSSDATFAQLRVWVDANSDGKTDAGELKTFAQLGITRIDLTNTAQSGEIRDGNEVLARGTFVQSGQTKEALAANFLANPNGTTYVPSGSGTLATTEGNVTSYVSQSVGGEVIDIASKGVKNAYGAQGDDTLIGDANDNWLAGGVGSDTFNAGAGDDVLLIDAIDLQANIHGGDGRDIVYVIGDQGMTLNLAQSEVEIAQGGRGDDIIIGGGSSNVFVRGGDGNDVIIGGAANDALSGEVGRDFVAGGGGNDLIRGHQGEDVLIGDAGDDIIEGGQDQDLLNGGDGNDVLQGDQGNDRIEGGTGVDVAQYNGSYADYRVTHTANGVWVSDTRTGRDGTDFLTGIEQLSFVDVAHIPIDIPSPLPVNDIVTVSGTGPYLILKAQLLANDLDYQGNTLSIASVVFDPTIGTAVLQGNGDVLFTPNSAYAGVMNFSYRINDGQNPGITWVEASTGQAAESKAVVTLLSQGQPTDPLFSQQWYLSDANVLPVWKDYTGKGVLIGQFEGGGDFAVTEEVFDYRHPDLAPNVSPDFLSSGTAPTDFSTHATLVAGVMVAARNGEGAVGVAYDAKLAGVNVSKAPTFQGADYYALDQWQQYDIANNSWGVTPSFSANMLFPDTSNPNPNTYPLQDALENAAQFGRGGLGTILVFAMGNDRTTGGNTNYSNLDNSNFVIGVGAINAPGDLGALVLPQKPFSAPGASLLISAPGSNILSTSRLQMNDNGSVFGNDSSVVQGTSLAAPIVSGIVALMLEANPNLGYRDVQEILAATAKQIDPNGSVWTFNNATGWNGGAMHFSDDYGFGLVDARAAVRLAETWNRTSTGFNGTNLTFAGTLNNTPIPDLGTVSNAIIVPTGLRVEHASVVLEWNHQRWGDLIVKLISPTGTESVLMNRPDKAPGGPTTDFGNLSAGANRFAFTTTHDWGEDSGGSWQIQVTDAAGGQTGAVVSWNLLLKGRSLNGATDPNNTYVYTNEYGTLGIGSRATLNDANGGIDEINAAAVTGSSSINLTSGSISTLAGRSLTIGAVTTIEKAIGGDGNDTITGNSADNRFVGGRGNDTISGGAGRDVLEDGRGSDTLIGEADSDLFVITKDANTADVVTDFSLTTEKILLVGFSNLTGFADLTISQQGANTRVLLGDGQSLVLNNTTSSALTADHFKFVEKFNFAGQFIGTNAADVGPTQLEVANSAVIDLSDQRRLYFLEGGNDRLFAGAGNDEIHGGDGDDFVVGENNSNDPFGGRDTVYGDAGNDILLGGGGNDSLYGGTGADQLFGNEGDDVLISGTGADYMEGNSGNDLFYLEGEEDTAYGGVGNDRFLLRAGTYNTGSGTGHDWIMDLEISNKQEKIDLSELTQITSFNQLQFADVVIVGFTNSFLKITVGPNPNDFFMVYNVTVNDAMADRFNADNFILSQGTSSNDTITGDADGTTLDGGLGADTITGRTGDDTYIVDNVGDVVNELPGGGFDTVKASVTRILEPDVENLVLTGTANINGTGNVQNNRITGNSGGNILDGGTGADTLIGGLGNDTYIVDHGSDSVVELAGGGTADAVQSSVSFTLGSEIENLTLIGIDNVDATGNVLNNALTGNAGDNLLDGAGGADTLTGGAGNDTYLVDVAGDGVTEQVDQGIDTVYASFTYTLGVNVEDLVLTGTTAIDGTGNTLDNFLSGNSASNTLTGGAGSDTLDGGAGVDSLAGGTGDDTYILDTPSDSITEAVGSGIDTVIAGFTYSLAVTQLENLTLTGTGNFNGTGNNLGNILIGNSGVNTLTGGTANDTLDGGTGNDVLVGGAGDDTYILDNSGDSITETAGNGTDTVVAGFTFSLAGTQLEHLTLSGFNVISATGNGGNNVLIGNSNSNTLAGGIGNDILRGGSGHDTYLFNVGDGSDTIDDIALPGEGNRIQFGSGLTHSNLSATRAGSTVTIQIGAGGDIIALTNFDPSGLNGSLVVETLAFSDGTTASVESLLGNIQGVAFEDVDVDGIRDTGESILAGRTVFLDADNDGLLDTGEVIAVTDATGTYAFKDISPGAYTVREIVPSHWFETIPAAGARSVVVNAGETKSGEDFGTTHATLDVDGNGDADALSDGIAIVRHLFGFTGTALTSGVIDPNGTRATPLAVERFLTGVRPIMLDVDGNGSADALSDGIAIIRFLFGFTDDALISGVVDPSGTRTTATAVETFLQQFQPPPTRTAVNGTTGNDSITGGQGGNFLGGPEGGNSSAVAQEGYILNGYEGDDSLYGGDGNDYLNGGSGADFMHGGLGDDLYVVEDATDVIVEFSGEGTDWVHASISYALGANVENLALDWFGSINGTGNALDNQLVGNNGNNVLDGGVGSDHMIGGLGSDTYIVDTIGDIVIEAVGEGIDTVQSIVTYALGSNVENLTLTGNAVINGTGNALDNILVGNTAINTLTGGAGNDTLDGGVGDDTMVGGSGNDTYVVGQSGDVVTELANEGTDTVQSSITYTLGTNVENLTLIGSLAVNGTGNALDNVLTDNSAANMLTGGAGNDTYIIGAGDTVVEAAGGGIDTVQSALTHTLGSNVENLTLTGNAVINGTGNALDNILIGNAAANTLTGGTGNDTLDGMGSNDTLVGGSGNDTYVVGLPGDVVTELANEGTDTVQSTISYTLGANMENLTLIGSLAVNGTGNALDNVLTGNSAANILAGGAGVDTYIVGLGDTVLENANEGTDTVQSTVSFALGANVENLTLTGTAAINGTGNSLSNVLVGNSTANVLDGGIGADTMTGGQGDDTYIRDHVGDVATELANEGTDTVESSLTYTLGASVENLTLTGSSAINGTGNTLANVLMGNSAVNVLTGGAGNDTYIIGVGDSIVEAAGGGTDTVQSALTHTLGSNLENLTLTGTANINATGNSLSNILIGNSGANVLTGGAGSDTYVVGAGDTIVESGGGTDTVQSSVTWTLGSNLENLTLTGTGASNGTGNSLNNVLTGNNTANVLDGGTGTDTLTGLDGDDIYLVDNIGDAIIESANNGTDLVQSSVTYTLAANMENLTLTGATAINGTGNTFDNVLLGNSANNTLTGGAGNDTLTGGVGSDTLIGGSGNDTYVVGQSGDVVTELANEGTDTVQSSLTYTLGANVENLTLTGSAAIDGTGNTLNNTLTGSSAANMLIGGAGDDTYVFSRTGGQDTIQDSSGTSDKLQFTTSINPLDLILERNANDLRISLYNSTDRVTIQNWYTGTTNQTETIQAGNGQQLLNTQVDQLIQAMASFTTQTGLTWEQGIVQQPQNVQAVLAASWQ